MNNIFFTKNDRVRHKNVEMDKVYGIMEIFEIKNDQAICRYGDYSNFGMVTFPFKDLKKAEN